MRRRLAVSLPRQAEEALEMVARENDLTQGQVLGRGLGVLEIAQKEARRGRKLAVVEENDDGEYEVVGTIDSLLGKAGR